MSAYLKELQQAVEAERQKHKTSQDEQERAAAEAAREKLVPLEARLRRVLDTIPPQVQAEGVPIGVLQARLRARGRGHTVCHIGELALALRRLNWRRVRSFKKSDAAQGFCARWFPPQTE